MTWDQIMKEAKNLFQTELIKQKPQRKKEDIAGHKEDAEYIANDVTSDVNYASFEVDLRGKPGLWRGGGLPYQQRGAFPKLRSLDDLADEVARKLQDRVQGRGHP